MYYLFAASIIKNKSFFIEAYDASLKVYSSGII